MAQELEEISRLDALTGLMRDHQVHTLVYKRLAPNDNSKNQIYLGGNYSALQLLPFGKVYTDESRKDSKRDRFKADLPFLWMDDIGNLYPVPSAQLILYPKYPEVRMSGFLKGAEKAPRRYLRTREEGRVMFLGITCDRRIIGHVIGPENPLIRELQTFDAVDTVFNTIYRDQAGENTKRELLDRLREIHEMGWVNSCKLNSSGDRVPYKAPNGGGYTLEALLGVIPNGDNEPDFLGWEIKQHKTRLDKPLSGGAITLMTPEPTGGVYKVSGVVQFIRQFGYPDKSGKPDRMNFGGIHKFGERQPGTGLTLELAGYDPLNGKIMDINGGITLLSDDGTEAAIWHFSSLLEKWNRKHAQAAYVPSDKRVSDQGVQYMYGHAVALGTGTDFSKFLSAMARQSIYYDPGIKVENISTSPKAKKRSQFRIRPPLIPDLYESMEVVEL
ncbi:MvaI/BcnI family restriction endonuclease [Terasakiella sp.]|uniref:MvaI/BcnI family restriction endonuclease n=1 Tax=Terasakiella sp. TaxID=2034861 RepID=UPI003AA7F8EF